MTPEMTPLVAWARPFARDVWRGAMPAGQSLAEIAAQVPDLPLAFWRDGLICVNGEIVERQMWRRVRPRPDSAVPVNVTLHLPMADGGGEGGGSKNVLKTVAAIALLAVTSFVAGGGFALAGGLFAQGSTSAALLAAGTGIAGALALQALFPPPSQPVLGQREEGKIGSAAFEQNLAKRGEALTSAIGTTRVWPDVVALPLTEISGDRETVETVLALGGPHKMSDLRLGDALSTDLSDIEYELREGLTGDSDLTLVTRQGRETQPAITLADHLVQDEPDTQTLADQADPSQSVPFWSQLETRSSPDEYWITLIFPEGAFNEANTNDVLVPFRLRMRQSGDTDWIYLPELHLKSRRQGLFRRMIKLKWADPGAAVTPPTDRGWVQAYREAPAQGGSGPATGAFTADSSFDDGSGYTDVTRVDLYEDIAVIWLDTAAFPQGTWEIQIIKGQPVYASSWSAAAYTYSSVIYDLFGYIRNGSVAQTILDLKDFHWRSTVIREASVWNEMPVSADDGCAKIALKVTDRRADRVSVLASRYVRDYQHGEWGKLTTTSNPAPHLREAFLGALNPAPLSLNQIDEKSLIEWRRFCAENGHEVNAVVAGQPAREVWQSIASAGYGSILTYPFGVTWERDRNGEDPVQAFSPRNTSGYRFDKALPQCPDAFLVTWRDRDNSYRQTETLVVIDGKSATDPGLRTEAIEYPHLDTQAAIEARALFDLRQARLRTLFHSFETDVESIVCRRGELVAFSHDVMDKQAGFGRIASIQTSGGLVTGVTLDQEVPVSVEDLLKDVADVTLVADMRLLGYGTGAQIRLNDGRGTLITKALDQSSGDTDTLTFATPFAAPSGLEAGCHVTTGLTGTESSRMIVHEIGARSGDRARLILVDEARGIHTGVY